MEEGVMQKGKVVRLKEEEAGGEETRGKEARKAQGGTDLAWH